MEVSYTSLENFLAGKKICTIPVYQRNYDWKKSHCEQLLADLEELIKNTKPEHFIGTVVYQENKTNDFTEQIIIDGQQRITSVILLAKAVYDLSKEEQLRDQTYQAFIKNTKYDTEFKLRPSKFDRETFRKLMDNETFDDMETSFIYLNYKFFKEKLSAYKDKLSTVRNAITKFQIAALKLGNENPQEIFESLNSTGKELTETELIRNYLLMDLKPEVQENLYQKYWLPIERMLKNSETVDTFLFQYLVSKRKSITDMQDTKNIHISKNELYSTFKKYFRKNYNGDKAEQVEKFLSDLKHYAEFYSRLIFNDSTDFENLSALEKKFYELVYLLDSKSMPIVLMDLNNKYENKIFDGETFLKMVDALISLTFRAKVCKASADNAQTAGNILDRLDKNPPIDIDSFWKAITAGNGKYNFPNDEQFKTALTSPEIYLTLKGDTCKYLLYKLEKTSNLPHYKNIYVDYVMPKKLSKNWSDYLSSKNDLDNHDAYLNSLGNLVLTADKTRNNAAFSEKRVNFATSNFYYTRSLSNSADWTSKQIRHRAEILAGLALKIWLLPEEYQIPTETEISIYTLDSNFKIFTGKKLSTISIFGKEKPMRKWRDFLREMITQLYNLDKEIFRQAANNLNRATLFDTEPKKFETPFEIDKNYYMEIHFRASECLNIIKNLVENFDRLGGTDFKSEIWFTLENS